MSALNRDDVTWSGYWPACPTPFAKDGSLDLETFGALLDFYLGERVHGVLVNGTTGEWFSQGADERRLVAEAAIHRVNGRVPVVIGCTAYTAKEAGALARHAMDAGADGVSSTAPPYVKPYEAETIAYFGDLCEAAPEAPLMVYNWPHGTSVEIGTDLAGALAGIESVVAIKDSTPDVAQFFATTRAVIDRVRVFGPFMSTEGLDFLREHGGDGTIGGGTLFGAPDPGFWEAYWGDELETCRAHAERIDRLFPKLWLPGGWGGHWGAYQSQLKALMRMLGQPGGEVRPPKLPVTDPESLRAMEAILAAEGLIA